MCISIILSLAKVFTSIDSSDVGVEIKIRLSVTTTTIVFGKSMK